MDYAMRLGLISQALEACFRVPFTCPQIGHRASEMRSEVLPCAHPSPNVHPLHPSTLPSVQPSHLTLKLFLDSFLASRGQLVGKRLDRHSEDHPDLKQAKELSGLPQEEHARNDSQQDVKTSWNLIRAMRPLGFLQGELAESLMELYGFHEASSFRFKSVLGSRAICKLLYIKNLT
ncbi:hypothetical protein CRG98_012008 [Punica granatum]|uniref:Uncharacterized protein n=1 Tax=Punica granatum TaxID=22663 RepID=A0A2I0KGG6_PUNGR|nr:hypothetical protein CRG98_012008 [Punica granatum]